MVFYKVYYLNSHTESRENNEKEQEYEKLDM